MSPERNETRTGIQIHNHICFFLRFVALKRAFADEAIEFSRLQCCQLDMVAFPIAGTYIFHSIFKQVLRAQVLYDFFNKSCF